MSAPDGMRIFDHDGKSELRAEQPFSTRILTTGINTTVNRKVPTHPFLAFLEILR